MRWEPTRVSDILRHRIVADSASPEMIRHLKDRGFNIVAAIKGKDSVEEGVRFIQMHHVIIHPDCRKAIEEWNRYSYKIDKDTEAVLPELNDMDNHVVDSVRYAVENDRRRQRSNAAGAMVAPTLFVAD